MRRHLLLLLRQYLRLGIFYVKNPNSTSRLSLPIRDRLNKVETVDVEYSFGGITAPGGHPIPIYDRLAGHAGFSGWTSCDMADQAYFAVASEDDLAAKWPLIVSANEAENVRRLTQWSSGAMLNVLTDDTSRQIFPTRKIGRLADGFEASFIAIDRNPLVDWTSLRRIAFRVKQGHVIEVPTEKPSRLPKR